MKKSDKFQIDYAWWDKNRPEAMSSTGLGAALKVYAAAKAKITGSQDSFNQAKLALDKVEAARLKAVGLCKGPLFPDAKVVLTGGAAVIVAEHKALLDAHRQLIRAKIAPLADELRTETVTLAKRQKAVEALFSQGAKVVGKAGASPTDPVHLAAQKVFKELDQLLSRLGEQCTLLSDSVADQGLLRAVTAEKNGALAAEYQTFTASRAALVEARKYYSDQCIVLDDWAGELKIVNKAYDPPVKRNSVG